MRKTDSRIKKPPKDKRVFEICATINTGEEQPWRLVAIGADCTILDLYLTLLGAFDWSGDYDRAEREYRVTVRDRLFADGKGSRTPLRRLLEEGDSFTCDAPGLFIACNVVKSYEVASRRHYPKVLDGGGLNFSAQHATWNAQGAMRREFRGTALPQLSPEYLHARLHGFFAAALSGPLLMPREWLQYATDFHVFEHLEAARAAGQSIMELHNLVSAQLHDRHDDFIAYVTSLKNLDANGEAVREWVRGYFDGIALRAREWEEFTRDKPIREAFMPFAMMLEFEEDRSKLEWLREAEIRGNIAQALGVAAVTIHEFWRRRLFPSSATIRRAEPKISPNAPCPCGSGKKYKRCCGSPLRPVPD